VRNIQTTPQSSAVTTFDILSVLNAEYLRYKGACHDSQTDSLDAPLHAHKYTCILLKNWWSRLPHLEWFIPLYIKN